VLAEYEFILIFPPDAALRLPRREREHTATHNLAQISVGLASTVRKGKLIYVFGGVALGVAMEEQMPFMQHQGDAGLNADCAE
jgi:hypothetical protein